MPSKKVAKRPVQCEKCSYKFESREARPHCGKCGSWEIKELLKPKETTAKEDEGPSKPVEYKGPLTTHLSGQELALAEVLINAGLAKNFPDLIKKSLRVTAATANLSPLLGGGFMQNLVDKKESDDPEKEIDKLQARRARDEYLEELREKLKRGKSLDSQELLDLLKQRQYFKMLEDMDKDKEGNGFGIKEIMQLQLLQSLAPQNRRSDNDEALRQQISELQLQVREQKQETKLQEMINRFESKLSTSKSGSEDMKTLKEFLLEIEKIREGSRAELEKSKTDIQTEIEKRKQLELDHKLQEISRKTEEIVERSQGKRGITKSDITEIKDTITTAKELAKEFGAEGKKGKDAGEIVTEIVGKTIENLTPIAQKYMEDKAKQPVYIQPIQPSVISNPINPQSPELSEEEMATPEEEMANMMHQQQKQKQPKE